MNEETYVPQVGDLVVSCGAAGSHTLWGGDPGVSSAEDGKLRIVDRFADTGPHVVLDVRPLVVFGVGDGVGRPDPLWRWVKVLRCSSVGVQGWIQVCIGGTRYPSLTRLG